MIPPAPAPVRAAEPAPDTRRARRARSAASESITPGLGRIARRLRFWIVMAVLALGFTLVGLWLTQASDAQGRWLDPADPSPTGSRAVATVLRERGIPVATAASLDEARRLAARPGAVLLYADERGLLPAERAAELLRGAERAVIVAPDFLLLREIAPGVSPAGASEGELSPGCALPEAERAGDIADANLYWPGENVGCYSSAEGASALVRVSGEGHTLDILGTDRILRNDTIASGGNAALALGLLGAGAEVVWYQPTSADLVPDGRTLQEATPTWLVPAIALVGVSVIAAMLWRGRRLGALVPETLPVIVPAGETMRGRARLYQRVGARDRALDALRIGALARLSGALGLPAGAGAEAVADAAAARVGMSSAEARALLIHRSPASESALRADSAALLRFEYALTAALRPGGAPRPSTTESPIPPSTEENAT